VANKDKVVKLRRYCKKQKLKLYEISAVTGEGIEQLKYAIADEVGKSRESAREAADEQAEKSS
jgi:GTPase